MKKGFTLIELLAVIVILAVIALIATPIVLNIINDSKESSLNITMSNVEKVVELYCFKNMKSENIIFECNNKVCIDNNGNKLSADGNLPESGKINISKSGKITYDSLIIGGYLCDKYNEEFVCNKVNGKVKEINEGSIILEDTKSTFLNNYKIYGESVQEGTPTPETPVEIESVGDKTKNLFDINKFKEIMGSIMGEDTVIEGVKCNPFEANSAWNKYMQVDCKENTQYTLSFKSYKTSGEATMKFRYSDGMIYNININVNANNEWLDVKATTVVGKTLTDIGGNGSTAVKGLYLADIQLEEGTKATEYEPYGKYKIPVKVSNDTKEITTNIYLDEPLRKLDSYVDYIDYKNQKLIRNVGVLKLNSEDDFEIINNEFVLTLESYPKIDAQISISNYLEYGKNFWFDGNKLKIKIEEISTIDELKTWLRDKNVEIYYPLSKSIISDIELPEININKNYSNIMIDTDIKPHNFLIEYN